VAAFAQASWALGLKTAILVTVPVPPAYALGEAETASAISQANDEAIAQGIRGAGVTPFILARLRELTHGRSLEATLALLRNNARVAAEIAKAIAAQ
jgi:pseudouridine-5'-phosphate glycosidase